MPDFGDLDPNTGRPSSRTDFEGTVDPLAPSVANGQITPAQWAEYQAKRRRAAILGTLGVLGGTVGLGFAGQALGGAGALGAGSGGGAGAGAGAATLPPAATAGMLPMSVAAGPTGVGAGAGAGAGILGGLGARDLAALGLTAAGTIGGALQDRPNMSPSSATSDPNIAALIQLMQRRLEKSEPLYDSALAMANGLLPTRYQKGGGGMG